MRDDCTGWDDEAPYTYISFTDKAYTESQGFSLLQSGKQVLIRKSFSENVNKVLSLWFYDDVTSAEHRLMACMEADDSNSRIALGVRSDT